MKDNLVLFVHGLGGHPTKTWGNFPTLIADDVELNNFDTAFFSFPTKIFSLPFVRQYSGIHTLSQALATQIDVLYSGFKGITLVCHSLGGLIAKKYMIDRALTKEPCRVDQAFFYAVPNNGSSLADVASYISLWNPHLRSLCKDSDMVRSIAESWRFSGMSTKIKVHYVVAAQDRVVTESSAQEAWGLNKVDVLVDKGHINSVKPQAAGDLSFLIFKNRTLEQRASARPGGAQNAGRSNEFRVNSAPLDPAIAKKTRISASVLLKVERNGKYLLIRNRHRPETFGPIGGVYKYRKSARTALEHIDFHPEVYENEMRLDLRGFVPNQSVTKFENWFECGEDRENSSECLIREISEEMAEISLQNPVADKVPVFRRVRRIVEGPEFIPALDCYQLRFFDIMEFSDDDMDVEALTEELWAFSTTNTNLKWVTSGEARFGRSADRSVIGSHVPYLFGIERFRQGDPPFSNSG